MKPYQLVETKIVSLAQQLSPVNTFILLSLVDPTKQSSYEKLNCGPTNLVYGINFQECRKLIYVAETGRSLRARMKGQRRSVRNNSQCMLQKRFHISNHCIVDMKVQILEKVSHDSKSPEVQKRRRRDGELFWIKELGTAALYGCNNQVKGVVIITSPFRQSNECVWSV